MLSDTVQTIFNICPGKQEQKAGEQWQQGNGMQKETESRARSRVRVTLIKNKEENITLGYGDQYQPCEERQVNVSVTLTRLPPGLNYSFILYNSYLTEIIPFRQGEVRNYASCR